MVSKKHTCRSHAKERIGTPHSHKVLGGRPGVQVQAQPFSRDCNTQLLKNFWNLQSDLLYANE